MRITNSMLITNMLSNLNKNLNVMSRKQDELSTGKKVIFASDDPVAAAKIIKFKTDIADMEQYSTNTRDAQAWLDITESTTAEMGSVLQRMRELAVKAANGTNTPSDTQKIKEEVTQLRENLIASANFNFAGRHIFSSHFTDQPLLKADGTYNIPITAEDLVDKPVAVYEVSSKEYMPVGTHGVEVFGSITEVSEFQNKMPDAKSGDGIAAQKASVMVDFDLTHDYAAGANINVTVNGVAYLVPKANMVGTVLNPLDMQNVLDTFKSGVNGAVKLSDVADVYFDSNKKLIVRDKTIGLAGTVQFSNFAGISNPKNITDTTIAPVVMASVSTAVAGINSAQATVTSAAVLTDANVPDFLGKKFVMTYNGFSKTILIPNTPLTITNAAQLGTAIQNQIDITFGVGKVVATVANGAAIKFETITGTTDPKLSSLRIQPAKTTTSELIKEVNDFIGFLGAGDNIGCSNMIDQIDGHLNTLLAVRADIGARGTRLDLISARIAENVITFTRLLSDSQDADMSEVIMKLKNAENVYKSALSVGGRIIQPSLLDFLR